MSSNTDPTWEELIKNNNILFRKEYPEKGSPRFYANIPREVAIIVLYEYCSISDTEYLYDTLLAPLRDNTVAPDELFDESILRGLVPVGLVQQKISFQNRKQELIDIGFHFIKNISTHATNNDPHAMILSFQMIGSGKTCLGENFRLVANYKKEIYTALLSAEIQLSEEEFEGHFQKLLDSYYLYFDIRHSSTLFYNRQDKSFEHNFKEAIIRLIHDHEPSTLDIIKQQFLNKPSKLFDLKYIFDLMLPSKIVFFHVDEYDEIDSDDLKPEKDLDQKINQFYKLWNILAPLQVSNNVFIFVSGKSPLLLLVGKRLFREKGIKSPDLCKIHPLILRHLQKEHIAKLLEPVLEEQNVSARLPLVEQRIDWIVRMTGGIPRLVNYTIQYISQNKAWHLLDQAGLYNAVYSHMEYFYIEGLDMYDRMEDNLNELYRELVFYSQLGISIPFDPTAKVTNPKLNFKDIPTLHVIAKLGLYTSKDTNRNSEKRYQLVLPELVVMYLQKYHPQEFGLQLIDPRLLDNNDLKLKIFENIGAVCLTEQVNRILVDNTNKSTLIKHIFPYFNGSQIGEKCLTLAADVIYCFPKIVQDEKMHSSYFTYIENCLSTQADEITTTNFKQLKKLQLQISDIDKLETLKPNVLYKPAPQSYSWDLGLWGDFVTDKNSLSVPEFAFGWKFKAGEHKLTAEELVEEVKKALHLRRNAKLFTLVLCCLQGVSEQILTGRVRLGIDPSFAAPCSLLKAKDIVTYNKGKHYEIPEGVEVIIMNQTVVKQFLLEPMYSALMDGKMDFSAYLESFTPTSITTTTTTTTTAYCPMPYGALLSFHPLKRPRDEEPDKDKQPQKSQKVNNGVNQRSMS